MYKLFYTNRFFVFSFSFDRIWLRIILFTKLLDFQIRIRQHFVLFMNQIYIIVNMRMNGGLKDFHQLHLYKKKSFVPSHIDQNQQNQA